MKLPARETMMAPKLIVTCALAVLVVLPLRALAASAVDFRFSPPEWQTAICLPDDPHKSLVDRSGELLYHYEQGGREFGTRIGVEVTGNAVWQKQELHSPRVPIVRTLHTTEGLDICQEAFAVTSLRQTNARNDLILIRVTNPGSQARVLRPRLIVDTSLAFAFQPETQRVTVNDHETITTSLKMTGMAEEQKTRRVIQLDELEVPAGRSATFFVLYSGGGSIVVEPATVKQALACRERAVKYWERAPLPFGRVTVPDAGIQALVDSSIRNIWQAREIKQGLPAFQVGPTCYRGLWIVDGAFLLEAAAMLGAGDQVRNGVAYELTYQRDDGRIDAMERISRQKGFWKENGIVLWTCVRHAQLTQDKAWLESVWPKLERTAGYIRTLRRQTLTNDSPLDDGLIPPGFPDGGIGGVRYEYTNPYWNLVGLRSFIEAARWLGKSGEAGAWQEEYDDFMAAFRKAAARDLRKDSRGNSYLPILMGDAGATELPQRGQWAFCHAVYPGKIFAKDDPLVAGNMAMLESTEREGMVYGTGWDATGIWNYFASFYAHAWLWQGNGRKAAQILYAYANHAAPTLVWREEQSLKGETFKKVGDMPHNWASAEFIRLVVHLLALDRGSELHLCEGLPAEWLRPGSITRLNGVATSFGPLTMELKVSANGRTATLRVEPLSDPSCTRIVVHLDGSASGKLLIELDPKRRHRQTITLVSPWLQRRRMINRPRILDSQLARHAGRVATAACVTIKH